MAEGDRWETSAKCKVCGWYAARLLRSKALKGDCPRDRDWETEL